MNSYFIEEYQAQVERQSQEEEQYHQINDCITRITNDPLFEVYQKHSKNDKLVTLKSAIKRKTLYSHQLGVTMSDLFLWELIKNHQDASTEFIVRLANDTLPASTNEQHELLTQ
tara:strand:+ start:5846 stop:6187 length:342 start_codon:yes stop_codon:yes gene_type:complete